jgi:predicted nucleic acid-binding protein
VIVADTSAWIEFLRATGSPVHLRMRRLIHGGAPVVTTEPVHLEVLAGPSADPLRLRRMLATFPLLPVHGLDDYVAAANLYRAARARGHTIRSLVDCLIAAVAIRHDATVLAADRDYAALAAVSPLRLEPA